jgi:PAS domain S-box-containing protein
MRLHLGWLQQNGYLVGGIALACFLSGRLSEAVLNSGSHASPIWFPAGIALASLLLFGRELWLGVFLGMAGLALSLKTPLPLAIIVATGNTLGAIAGETLLRRANFRPALDTLRDVLNFLGLAVILSPTVNATINTFKAALGGAGVDVFTWQAAAAHWITIWLGDGMGILVATPLLLVWLRQPVMHWLRSPRQVQASDSHFPCWTVEFLVWLLLLAGCSWVVFKSPAQTVISHYPLEYLPFPFIAWAALRLGQKGTVLGSLIVSAVAIIGTMQQGGPFLAKTNNPLHAIFLLQIFVGIITATALVLAAAVTERQQVTDLLRRSEERFRVIAETTACAVVVYQGDRLCYANPAAEQISEYSREELLSMRFWDLVHPEYLELMQQRMLARQRGEPVPGRYEMKILSKTGKERWIDFTAGNIHFEGKPAGLATAYDVTNRKQAEAKLILSAERERLLGEISTRIRSSLKLEEILQNTVDEVRRFLQADRVLIACLATAGQCQAIAESVDPNWAPALGWEVSGEQIQEIRALFATSRTRVIHDTAEVELTPFLSEYYQRCQVKAGVGVALILKGELFGVLIANQCSAPRQWKPFEIDLLEQLANQVEIAIQQGQLYRQVQTLAANLEQQVEERTAELQQRMRELQTTGQVKDLLLHAVSHDLRTPIQGMLMVLNNLRNRCEANETVTLTRSMLDCMIRSGTDQLRLLSSLRDEQSSDEATPALNWQTVHLKQIVQSALVKLNPQLDQNQVTLINQIDPDLQIKGDPQCLEQVFENLLLNAVQHNLPGVTIALDVKATSCSSRLTVAVADTGQGMNPEQCDRLFKPYVRSLDNPHRTGIGLGLYRCHQIISAHGGEMGVTSSPGSGSTLWFALPLA